MPISEAYGSATSLTCPKGFYVWLRIKETRGFLVVKTTCRTWNCLGCRDRNLRAVRLRIEFGSWTEKPSYFITLTYRYTGSGAIRRAVVVRRHLARLLEKWRVTHPNLKWIAIPELTKKGQVHLHLIVSSLDERQSGSWACQREPQYGRGWRQRACLCLEHQLSRLWHIVTGDSFVVDVRPVMSSANDASYLSKYLVKGMAQRREMVRLGFARRWSCSRNWPRPELKMRGTVDDAWEPAKPPGKISGRRNVEKALAESLGDPLLDRVGAPSAMAFDKRLRDRAVKVEIERALDNLRATTILERIGVARQRQGVRGDRDPAGRGVPRR